MEGNENRNDSGEGDSPVYDNREELFSKVVRAGKRTYFFDVKATRGNDFYLTVTESKKRFNREGRSFYEKHKLFLYKEDFDKFQESLEETIEKIKALREAHEQGLAQSESEGSASSNYQAEEKSVPDVTTEHPTSFTEVSFDDLGSDKE